MDKIFFATRNKDKIFKMKNRLQDLKIEILTPYDFDISINIDENGTNVIENATLKAKAYFNKLHIPTIATDSSLYVEKFKVQPGLFVRRVNGVTLEDDALEQYYINELNKIGGKSKANYITGVVCVQENKINSIEIKEDEFLFTSECCNDNRTFDPLSRLEFDIKLNKYFCQLNEQELNDRNYNFDIKTREFIKQVITYSKTPE